MDAISFVLGVRSAQLRSTQLTDLIYRGSGDTPERACVVAVIEDDKGMEHRFERSVAHGRGSEYRYNGRAVSQATYQARLEQLHILVKARNFLVFQGDVESIAERCSQDLSHLLDQISGSHAFASEYETARSGYDEAVEQSAALVAKRKSLQSEVRQFRQHKEATDRYDELKLALHDHEVRKILWRLYHIHEIIEIHTDWIEAHASRGEQARKRLEEKEALVDAARSTLGVLQQQLMYKENERKQAVRALDAKRPERDRLVERAEHSRHKLRQAQALYSQAEKDAEAQKAALERLAQDAELAERASAAAKADQEAALAASALKLSDADLQAYHDLRAQSSRTATTERAELERVERARREKQTALDTARDQLEQLAGKDARLAEQTTSLEAQQAELADREPAATQQVDGARERLGALRAQREQVATRERELNETLVECYQQLLQLGQDAKIHERESRLREALRSLRSVFPGVHGRLVELCQPTQRRYELAVVTALGRDADAVVVSHEKTALECIEYLRNQRAGQATFIPLDTIQTKPINDRLRSLSPHARLAVDVIQHPPALERAVHYACGNALVCDSLDVARELCYERGQRIKAVTLEGTVIHKAGMITGGPSMQHSARRWDEAALVGVQRERDRCLAELKGLQQRKYELGDEDDATAALTRAQTAVKTVRAEQADVARRLADTQAERDTLRSTRSAAEAAVQRHEAAVAALAQEARTLERAIFSADDELFADFCARIGVANVREYEANQLQHTQALSLAAQQCQRQLARLAHQRSFMEQQQQTTHERLAFIQASIDRETARAPRLDADLAACDAEMATLRTQSHTLQDAIMALRAEHASQSDVLADKRRAVIAGTRDVEAHRREVASRQDEMEQLAAERVALFRRCRLEAIDLPLLAGDLASVPLEGNVPTDESLTVDFAQLTDAERSDRSSAREAELQARIDAARDEMARLAPNTTSNDRLGSLERELQACEREMDGSRAQVRDAREELHAVRKQRTDLFLRAYQHIAERIDGVYKELTRSKAAPMGGVAYLTLEDSDVRSCAADWLTQEPFRSGIRYHAMPPMKRFRDMDQLSGGEKTIAALALLFAIHTYQPAPFFVLDEVDAALDGQNVARVSNYIREHASDRVQFIVISLKVRLPCAPD